MYRQSKEQHLYSLEQVRADQEKKWPNKKLIAVYIANRSELSGFVSDVEQGSVE